jgi:predicted Zn-dependent peptidase
MDVIRREMDMGQDDPHQRSARRLFETAYTKSPYRFTIIGYPDIFNEVRREDVYAYYKEKYAPNNVFFVVVGDINAAEVEEQIRSSFANAKARPMPPAVLPPEPKQISARAKSPRKRPSRWAISILAGTSRNCAILTCRFSTCSRRCSAADAVRACINRSARRRAS